MYNLLIKFRQNIPFGLREKRISKFSNIATFWIPNGGEKMHHSFHFY